jgi:hypothetical protein
MKPPITYHILKHFSAVERNRLEQFVQSPYFNQRKDVLKLFRLLDGLIRDVSPWPGAETINAKVYEDGILKKGRWYKTCSLLQQQIERFLLLETEKEGSRSEKVRLAAAFRELGLEKMVKRNLLEARKLEQKEACKDADFYEQGFRYYLEEFALASRENRLGDYHLKPLNDALDAAFVIRKLRYACITLTHKTLNPKSQEPGMLSLIIGYLQNSSLLDLPVVALYYYAYQMLAEGEKTAFDDLHRELLRHEGILPQEEIRDLFLMAINFCIRELNGGRSELAEPGLDLFKRGLETGLLLRSGRLSRFTYYNCFVMALSADAHSWAASFLDDYKPLLELSEQEGIYNFCRMRLAYEQGDYDQALDLFRFLDYPDLLFQLSARTIQLKVYYELGEFDLLQSRLDALNAFLQRKKVMGYHKQNYRNILRYIRKLLQMNPFDKSEKEALRKAVQEEPVLTEREWFLRQVDG